MKLSELRQDITVKRWLSNLKPRWNTELAYLQALSAYTEYTNITSYELIAEADGKESARQTPFKTRIDEHCFSPESMNLRKWYIVGYIIGDGCVNGNRLSISTTDKDNLYDMRQYMNLDTDVYIQQEKDYPTKYTIAKQSKQWFNDLGLYGIVPRKTFTSYIPLDYLKTPEEEAAILLGLFDSDGSISYHNLDYLSPVFSVWIRAAL